MGVVVRGGVRLAYEDIGAGPAVLFHTGAGGDAGMWRTAGYVDALPDHRCVLFDHRGHGRSDKPRAEEQHGLQEYVDDVIAVLDACDIDRVALVGYSDGAYLAFVLAAQYPQRVSAIVAIGCVVTPERDLRERHRSAAEVRRDGVRARIEAMQAYESEPAPAWLVDNLCTTSAEMFASELDGWADSPPPGSHLADISAPTLILCGAREDPDRNTELAGAGLANVEVVTVADLGHLGIFWRVDLVGRVVADFLHRHAG